MIQNSRVAKNRRLRLPPRTHRAQRKNWPQRPPPPPRLIDIVGLRLLAQMSATSPSALADQTDVGSYFVATYPPFSVWSREAVDRDARPALQAPPDPATPLGLYLHIPFCRKRCHFCYFRVYTDKNAQG